MLDTTYRSVSNVIMRNPEFTKNYIIEVAAPVFNRNGYAGTSLSVILEHTLLTKGAIYHHFKNKDELALAALEYNLKKVSGLHFNILKEAKNPIERLVLFAESFRKNYDLVKHMGGCPVVNAAVDSDDMNEHIRERVNRFIRMWKKSVRDIIESGKQKSEIKADADSEKFSMNFISVIEGGLAMSKATDDRKFLENSVDLVLSLINGIRN